MQDLNQKQINMVAGGLTNSQMTGLVASVGQVSGLIAGNVLAKTLAASSLALFSHGTSAIVLGTALGPIGGLLGVIAGYEAGNYLFPEQSMWDKFKGVFS